MSSSSEKGEFLIRDFSASYSNLADVMPPVLQLSFCRSCFLPFVLLEIPLPTFCTENGFCSIPFVWFLEENPLSIIIILFYPLTSELLETAVLLN